MTYSRTWSCCANLPSFPNRQIIFLLQEMSELPRSEAELASRNQLLLGSVQLRKQFTTLCGSIWVLRFWCLASQVTRHRSEYQTQEEQLAFDTPVTSHYSLASLIKHSNSRQRVQTVWSGSLQQILDFLASWQVLLLCQVGCGPGGIPLWREAWS